MTNENKKKRYYWFKLKLSFLDSPKVDFLMSQRGGSNYVVIYQMLCLKAINNNGKLQTNVNECRIKWDDNKIQRECKYFDIDTIRIAMTLFLQLGLIVPDENGILQIQDYDELVGSETNAAIEQRKYRNNKDRQRIDNKIDNVYLENSNIIDIDSAQKIDKRIDNVYQDNRYKNLDVKSIYNRENNDKNDRNDKTICNGFSKNPFVVYLISKKYITEEDIIDIPFYENYLNSLFEGLDSKSDEWNERYKNVQLAVKYVVGYQKYLEFPIENKFAYFKETLDNALSRNYDALPDGWAEILNEINKTSV